MPITLTELLSRATSSNRMHLLFMRSTLQSNSIKSFVVPDIRGWEGVAGAMGVTRDA